MECIRPAALLTEAASAAARRSAENPLRVVLVVMVPGCVLTA